MNRVLTITRVELVRFLRERGNVFFVFVLPLGLVLFIGLQFGAGGGGPQLGVVSPGDAGALALVERIDAGEAEVVEVDDAAELESLVSRGNLSAGIVIPAGYGAALEQAQPIDVGFVGRPDARAASLRTVVEAAIAEQAAAPEAARTVASVTGEEPAALLETAQEVAASLPRLEVVTTAVGGDELAAEFAGLGQFDLGATSQLFLFVFLTSLAGSAALIQARQYGVATRMLSTPTRLPTIVSGLVGGRLAIAGFQAVYIMVVTAVAFRVDWGDPLATGAVVALFCIVAAAAAMVLGSLFRNDSQAGSAGVGLGLVLAMLGGSMVPLEVFPDGMQRVAMLTPHGWANTAMAEVVRRGGGIADIATELAVLAGMAAGLLALATWLLRRTLTR
jgi:ABC-2 type transport system permease protein